ncbi:MAG: putative type IX secretion system sortase PorU2, partial [Bacteroidia bacterium]
MTVSLKAQVYGNTWINHSQQYVKFPISKEGIYRIDSLTLSAHYNLSSIDPRNFQLFIKGKEQFLDIVGEGDGKININDYIQFYASPFVGDIDSLLYTNIGYMPNPFVSIFNDTLYGFLTLNNSFTNKRYQAETDTNSVLYENADHFYTEKILTGKSSYNVVGEYPEDISDPRYTQAEGYGLYLQEGLSVSTSFGNLNTYTTTPLPCSVTVNFSGANVNNSVLIDHHVQTYYSDQSSVPVLKKDTLFKGFLPVRQTFTLNSTNTNSSTGFTLTAVTTPSFGGSNNSILHYLYYFYPQTTDLNNKSFQKLYVDNSISSTKNFYNFSNFNFSGSSNVLLYDLTNNKKITTTIAGSMLRTVIPDGAGRKLCVLAAESQTMGVNLRKVNDQTGTFTNFKTSGGNKPYIIIYNKITKTGAQAYQAYRQSLSGGGFNVISADIDELYEQFGYGINKHPLSITHFARFLYDSLPVKPKYFFLIGKSVACDYFTPSSSPENLIPTIGIPSCDNMLVSALTSSTITHLVPDVPVGRLSALSNSEVAIYLAKIQQHESSAPAEWKKKVLHFIGGDDPSLNSQLSLYMSSYEQIIKDTLFGADVLTFKKNTTAPIQINISDSIKNTISHGAALLNFFGHGSEQGFDQAIDDPNDYNNPGKYPFIIANACFSGNIHVQGRRSISEKFVFADQKGSIGFIATTSFGFVHALHSYSTKFYEALSRTRYNMGIGDIVKEAVTQNSVSYDSLVRFTALDMTLHGDPALKITNGPLPDYQIKNSSIVFDTKTYSDSIGIIVNMTNLGKAVRDSFIVKIERYFPNGDSSLILKTVRAPLFKDSVSTYLLIDFTRGIGLNKFKVKIDDYNEIAESIETNNSTTGTVDVFIQGGDIMPVYPYKYAIVPKTTTITLKASTTDPFAPIGTYKFQLDTCDKFVSPIQSSLISSKGGVIEWVVNLPFADSTVYFWRVSRDSTNPSTPFSWRESSFQTINTKNGWGQAHFHQFKNDGYQFVQYKKQLRQFVFENDEHSILVHNFFQNSINVATNINFFFDNILMSYWGCAPNGWNFALFDEISGQPDQVVGINYPAASVGYSNNCVCVDNQVLHVYSFGANNYCGFPNWKTDMEGFLNSIPQNKYVLAYTVGEVAPGYAQITTYPNSIYTAFESIGSDKLRNLSDTVPYILFGKKGMTMGQGHEVVGRNKGDVISLEDSIKTKWHNGYVASELIGPSYKWNSLHWRVQSIDQVLGDTTVIKIVGYKNNGQIDTLATFTEDSLDVLDLGNYADATLYPYMKLVAYMKDNVKTTSPQLKRWQVLYDEAPECAINPLKGFQSVNDTLQEGDNVTFTFPIENIGIKNFTDSLVVTYWIEDNNRNKTPLPQKMKSKPFVPGQLFIDTVKVNSYQFAGNNSLWLYVNPTGNSRYQKEQYQFNNIGRFGFKVSKDVTNPLLDVTFDGIRILNGDIVSAKPTILITLKDENKFLQLNDTGAFTIYLQSPNSGTQQRIYFAQGLQFTPANLPNNSCSILYSPNLAVDGKYKLTVQAKDRSN